MLGEAPLEGCRTPATGHPSPCEQWIVRSFHRAAARVKIASSIVSVTRPVKVFCWLGW